MFRSLLVISAILALGLFSPVRSETPSGRDSFPAETEAPFARAATLAGTVTYDGEVQGPVVVELYALPQVGGRPGMLSKADILGGREPTRTVTLSGPDSYRFDGLEAGRYSVLAFVDINQNHSLDFDPLEPLGWYTETSGGWVGAVDMADGSLESVDLVLRAPRPFSRTDRVVENGALRWMNGLPVLQLKGTPEERGYAHGLLVGPQIVDFFEFYVLEDSWRSADRYEAEFVPFLQTHFDYDPAYLAEADAVIRGMRASGMDMRVQWLGRDFRRVDLLAINAYIERRAARPSPPAASPAPSVVPSTLADLLTADGPACSQFAFWGEATEGSELEGGLIAGRNMDGEVDLRKVTVSHFLLFAVDPAEPGRHRWISTMWPGFIGTISGINEAGLYSMEDAGGTGPGPVVDGLTPCTWTQREIL